MNEDDLAAFVCPDDPSMGHRALAAMSPEKRATIERMRELEGEIALWQAGLGPKPTGAILCGPKQVRAAGVKPERTVLTRRPRP